MYYKLVKPVHIVWKFHEFQYHLRLASSVQKKKKKRNLVKQEVRIFHEKIYLRFDEIFIIQKIEEKYIQNILKKD